MAELSIRYATALFDLSTENGTLKECLEEAVVVRDTLQTDECRRIMEHPNISGKEKYSFLHKVFAGGLSEYLNGFLRLLTSKRREQIIVSALTEFINMGDSVIGKTKANVVSATELDENQVYALESLLSKKLGKQVEISLEVVPALIGGFYVQVGNYYFDSTIKKQLSDIKNTIKADYRKS